jgi:haloalkane dehalogenase
LEEQLASLADRPFLMIWGMRDWCFRPQCLDRLLTHVPRAEVCRLPDVGHWIVEEAPDRVQQAMGRFLAEHPLPCEDDR